MKESLNVQKTRSSKNFHVIIVLGAPNDSRGELSPIALGRAQTALEEYRRWPGSKILLTGGYGKHFNVTRHPHAYYLARFLIRNGVARADLLEFAESSNTVEDALFSERILRNHEIGSICVITSEFHLERAQLIFKHVFPRQHLHFIGAPSQLSQFELERLHIHEQDALRELRKADGFIGKGTNKNNYSKV